MTGTCTMDAVNAFTHLTAGRYTLMSIDFSLYSLRCSHWRVHMRLYTHPSFLTYVLFPTHASPLAPVKTLLPNHHK